jgi:hypothetical protein
MTPDINDDLLRRLEAAVVILQGLEKEMEAGAVSEALGLLKNLGES